MAGYATLKRQPQGSVTLVRGSRLLVGAQAILTGTARNNLVSGVALVNVGTVTKGAVAPSHIADNFRKSTYRATELLPAVGTADFVEFWFGYPRAFGSAAATTEGGFVTGSSTNQTGLLINMRAGGPNWGAIYDFGSGFYDDSGQALTLNALTFLLLARYQNRTELWRGDGSTVGRLIASFPHTPISYPASKFIIGSFIEDTAYWSSSSDTILAGRVVNTWASTDIQSFMANPWQIFQGGQRRLLVDSAASGGTNTPVNLGAGALAFTGFGPSLAQTASQSLTAGAGALTITGYAPSVASSAALSLVPAVGAMTITGYAPTVTQPRALTAGVGAMTLTGYAPTVSRTVTGAYSPAPGSISITGFAPAVFRQAAVAVTVPVGTISFVGYAPSILIATASSAPQLSIVTIMRKSTVNIVAQLTNQTNSIAKLL